MKITRSAISTAKAPSAIGPYNQAIMADQTLYISGQLGLDPETMNFVHGGVEEQARRAMQNIENILKTSGMDFGAVIKTTILLADMNDFAAINRVYEEFLGDHKPARSAFQVAGIPKGGRVEIEAVAVAGVLTSGSVLQF